MARLGEGVSPHPRTFFLLLEASRFPRTVIAPPYCKFDKCTPRHPGARGYMKMRVMDGRSRPCADVPARLRGGVGLYTCIPAYLHAYLNMTVESTWRHHKTNAKRPNPDLPPICLAADFISATLGSVRRGELCSALLHQRSFAWEKVYSLRFVSCRKISTWRNWVMAAPSYLVQLTP